jgi:hypothetical protein
MTPTASSTVVRHHDKNHQHCHILLNRIRTDRTVVPQQYREYLRNKETCRALERDFGLRPVRSERSRFDERAPTRAEDRMARDRGLVSEKEQLKALIRDAARDAPTMSEFVRRLQAKGVQVHANIVRTRHVSGISFRLDRVAVKGSGIGRAYSFEGLQKEQGVQYDARATCRLWNGLRVRPRALSPSAAADANLGCPLLASGAAFPATSKPARDSGLRTTWNWPAALRGGRPSTSRSGCSQPTPGRSFARSARSSIFREAGDP